MAIQILIIATYPIIRAGLRTFVEADLELEIVGEAKDKAQALELFYDLTPDIILVGLVLADSTAIETALVLFEGLPITRTLLVVSSPEIELAIEARTVVSYVPATVRQKELCEAIKVL